MLAPREKLGVLTKKVVLFLYFRNKSVFNLQQVVTLLGGEMKKVIEILFILQGVGLIFRVSRNKFVFRGFEGMIHKFHGRLRSVRVRWVQAPEGAKEEG